MMTKEDKLKLKAMFPTGWAGTIVKRTGLSESYVRRVMSGLATHVLIEKEALMIVNEYQKEINEVEKLKSSVL